ncbi:MAG: alpha/beta hydrolase [Gammaproteobacteria bacterium]
MPAGILTKTRDLLIGNSQPVNLTPLPTPTASIRLGPDREIAYDEYGKSDGYPLFYFHDSGSSRLESAFFHRSARNYGYRILAMDRPGVGCSSYYDLQSAREFGDDVLSLADRLGIRQFGVMSLGSGGIFALTLAHHAPKRVSMVVNLAGLPANVFNENPASSYTVSCINEITPALVKFLVRLKQSLFPDSPQSLMERLQGYVNFTDRKLLANPRVKRALILDQAEVVRQGYRGLAQDIAICFRKLDFKLEEVSVPTTIWQGTGDRLSQRVDCEYMAARIPRASYYRIPNRGHYFFITGMDEVFGRLRSYTQIRRALAA